MTKIAPRILPPMVTGSSMLLDSATLDISVKELQNILCIPAEAPLDVVIVSFGVDALSDMAEGDLEVMVSLQVSVVGCGLQLPSSPHSTNVSTSAH